MNTRIALALLVSAPLLHAGEWMNLFDGKSLDGWTQKGGEAKYAAEDGAIVGRSVPNTSNSFLCTEKHYGDFELELEFKVHPELNSGIQIRSNSLPAYKNGQVHGYQCEIDPGKRAWSCGIYDEGRRGWLHDLKNNAPAREAFKQNEWNHCRIIAAGPCIQTWINGVPAACLVDAMTPKGFIGLQVHGVGGRADPLDIRWRNIRLREIEPAWKPLFNGKDLTGWKPTAGGTWKVENGIARGTSPRSESRHGILMSEATYKDFTARIVYRSNQGNSGFYFRVEPVDHAVAVAGFQAEIDANGNDVGGLYETRGRAWVVQPKAGDVAKYYRKGDWNEMIVSAIGRNVTVTVNGTRTAQLVNDKGRTEGRLGLQMHGGQDMDIAFKSVELLNVAYASDGPAAPNAAKEPAKPSGPVVPPGAKVKKLADGFRFTEGPAQGPDGKIYFSDIPNSRIHVHDPATGKTAVHRENSNRANGLMFAGNSLYACEGGARRVTRQDGDTIVAVAETFEGKKLNSPNDLDFDNKGGFYFTDPRYGSRGDMQMKIEGVYYRPKEGELMRVVGDMKRPNGIVLSLDHKTLYIADTGAREIRAYDVQPDAKLANGRKFAPVGSDGMTLDERGNLYTTSQGKVMIWNPDGKKIGEIEVPEGPANVTFGGPDKRTLYITASKGFYSIELGVRGR